MFPDFEKCFDITYFPSLLVIFHPRQYKPVLKLITILFWYKAITYKLSFYGMWLLVLLAYSLLGNLLKKDMILLYYNALHILLSTLLQLASTLSYIHAYQQECLCKLVPYGDRPLKSWGGRGTSDPCTLSFLPYRTLNCKSTATLDTTQSQSTLATGEFSLFDSNMSFFTCHLHLRLPSVVVVVD